MKASSESNKSRAPLLVAVLSAVLSSFAVHASDGDTTVNGPVPIAAPWSTTPGGDPFPLNLNKNYAPALFGKGQVFYDQHKLKQALRMWVLAPRP